MSEVRYRTRGCNAVSKVLQSVFQIISIFPPHEVFSFILQGDGDFTVLHKDQFDPVRISVLVGMRPHVLCLIF